eukprot:TRINITY_DN2702_c0_g1_i2.p1 TRINITY_DN2702_c0_g1~~TRINITY_DN2702_c0_g1_i2.p1  ORF type:complete len:126 (-),score=6.44 TRINITY_DN2702_c0_g1_i2:207-584(-)
MVRMMIMNCPDIDSDLQGGKITLTARLGLQTVSMLYFSTQVCVLIFSAMFWLVGLIKFPVFLAFAAVFYKGIMISQQLRLLVKQRDASPSRSIDFGSLPFDATIHVLLTALCTVIANVVIKLGSL